MTLDEKYCEKYFGIFISRPNNRPIMLRKTVLVD